MISLGVVERKGLVRLIPMADVASRTVLRRLFKTSNLEDVEAFHTAAEKENGLHRALRRVDVPSAKVSRKRGTEKIGRSFALPVDWEC